MSTTEHTINDALAGELRKTRHSWRHGGVVKSEQLGMLQDSAARADILVLEPNVSPVAVEIEVLPALTVELDAASRLGERLRLTGRPVLSAVAVRLPMRMREKQGDDLRAELSSAVDIDMALLTGSAQSDFSRWPQSGWIVGDVGDLSVLVQMASVPPSVIDEAVDRLVAGVQSVAGLLNEMAVDHAGSIHQISMALCQEDGEQTRRMAGTILANAFIFHEMLAGGQGALATVRSLDQLKGSDDGLAKSAVLVEWRKILEVNYWPIFDIARRILEAVPAENARPLLDALAHTADQLLETRLMQSHDLTGAVFQRLIADRKFLAAFYTTPASASLLAGLAVTPKMLSGERSWSKPEDVKALRIADFACGTGTLLSAAYQRVGQLHEIAGGDAEALHPEMMESALVGCDVLPAAAHLTASTLSGAHPTVKYAQSSILTVAYGRQPDGAIALGSLDLLDPQGVFSILAITARAAEGLGEAEKETWRSLPHESFDLVIMNPPFTRATGHEGQKVGIPNPMFAAFGSTKEEQKAMGKATKRLTADTSAHGNAGEASIFLVLAHRKLKEDGTLALVMPLSLMSGESWEESRLLLAGNYTDLVLASISGEASGGDLSFSADTGMGECLVVGRRSAKGSSRATFAVLKERPPYPLIGASAAEQILRLMSSAGIRRLEDGPVGGTRIHFGDDVVGQVLDAPLPSSGGWNLSRIADLSLAQAAYQMANEGRIWLPTMNRSDAIDIPMTTIAAIGEIGPYHADINGTTSIGGIRGPFTIAALSPNTAPTYPVLWAHDAETERTMAFGADCEGIPRAAATTADQAAVERKVAEIWSSASNCHFNRDFQFNSQSTAMQCTAKKTIGGRAWLSIKLPTIQQEKALVLWANTSLGLLLHWWHANKQQIGRGNVSKLALRLLPVLDVTALGQEQLDQAEQLFDALATQELRPINEIEQDAVRHDLDRRFTSTVLGATGPGVDDALETLRMKLSREPSVRGRKEIGVAVTD